MKRLSIVIPIYNAEQYIDKCLSKLLKQISSDDEVILINDGSSDGSEEKCKYYQETQPNVRYYTTVNGGPSKARNEGLKKANGKYLIFLDSDDYIEDNYISQMLKYIENFDLVVCGYNIVKEFNGKTEKISIKSRSYSKEDIIDLLCNSELINVLWNKIYKLDIIKKYNIQFDEEEFRGEDLLFNLDYAKNIENVYVTEEILYNYIMKSNGLNMGYNENLKSRFKRTKKVYKKMMKASNKDKKKIRNFIMKLYKKHIILYLKYLKNKKQM